jgi:protein phosphatase 1G
MEDAHIIALDVAGSPTCGLFGVFDGHGGKEVAKFTANHITETILSVPGWNDGHHDQALSQAFLRIDELLVQEQHREELKVLSKAGDSDGEGGHGNGNGNGNGGGPTDDQDHSQDSMLIPGNAIPEHLLEALGMPAGLAAGFHIRLVKSAGGQHGIHLGFDDGFGEEEEATRKEGEGKGTEQGQSITDDGNNNSNINTDDKDNNNAAKRKWTDQPGGRDPLEDGRDVVGVDEDPAASAGGGNNKNTSITAAAAAISDDSNTAMRDTSKEEKDDVTLDTMETAPDTTNATTNDDDNEAAMAIPAGQDVGYAVEELQQGTPETDDYPGPTAGCTAVCALVHGDQLIVANAGDSRCILSRNGRAIAMTNDHKPTDQPEYDRIIKAGGFVADGRVNGSLNLSRALGDMEYKKAPGVGPEGQAVTAVPEVRGERLQEGDEFLVLACDGIWDVLTNQEAVDFVRVRLQGGKRPREIAEEMCDFCLAPDTNGCGKGCDNMSVVVVVLKPFARGLHEVGQQQRQQQRQQ